MLKKLRGLPTSSPFFLFALCEEASERRVEALEARLRAAEAAQDLGGVGDGEVSRNLESANSLFSSRFSPFSSCVLCQVLTSRDLL